VGNIKWRPPNDGSHFRDVTMEGELKSFSNRRPVRKILPTPKHFIEASIQQLRASPE
jgi:hypothetical protein